MDDANIRIRLSTAMRELMLILDKNQPRMKRIGWLPWKVIILNTLDDGCSTVRRTLELGAMVHAALDHGILDDDQISQLLDSHGLPFNRNDELSVLSMKGTTNAE